MSTVDMMDDFDDHPSISASLEDFEHNGEHSDEFKPPVLDYPSHHSGFYSSDNADSDAGSDSGGPFNPPALRPADSRNGVGPGWFRQELYQQHNVSRDMGVSAAAAARSRLSPSRSPMHSPMHSRETSPQHEEPQDRRIAATMAQDGIREPSPEQRASPERHEETEEREEERPGGLLSLPVARNANNYIRFALKAELQHPTEAIDIVFDRLRTFWQRITRSKTSTIYSTLILILSYLSLRFMFTRPPLPPSPDLVKVAGLASAYEPLIFFSENSLAHVEDLQETGTAVWDLGESVRYSSIPSSRSISETLDSLSDNLKQLAMAMTKFFAVVDGDVDGIIIVMAWAKSELSAVPTPSIASITTVYDNMHSLLSRVGVLSTPDGIPTPFGQTVTNVFGDSTPQRAHATLERTFHEFLTVLENSINRELAFSVNLFSLFDAIDAEFSNVAQSAIRESGGQEREEGEVLSSWWARVIGTQAAQLRKFERNKELLLNVRRKTIGNRHLVAAHHAKLSHLKANLEVLRASLVSGLIRSNASASPVSFSVQHQLDGLEATYSLLKLARDRQKLRWKHSILTATERFSAAADRLVGGERDAIDAKGG